jgi:hypothetical protein
MTDGIGGVEMWGEDGSDISWEDEKQEEEAEEAEEAENEELGR